MALPRPDVDRMEYQFELIHHDGSSEIVCDPHNPLRAGGAFGDKSVLEFPGYEPPKWVDRDVDVGEAVELSISSRALRARQNLVLWTPAGYDATSPLPLLLTHDGPEVAEYSSLLRYLAIAVADGVVPPLHAVLLAPIDRDRNYSASTAYARSLVAEVVPAVRKVVAPGVELPAPVAMGASLGGLASLHAQRTYPDQFAGLYLQSSSFFQPRYDDHESGFAQFRRIVRFVQPLLTSRSLTRGVPVTITCGTVEENLANNRDVAQALAEQGYDVRLVENRDSHNWIGWRDTFDPHLGDLLLRAWT